MSRLPSEPDGAASTLVAEIREGLRPVDERIRAHPYLAALEEGAVARESLAAFAGEQRAIIASDLLSFAHLVGRCPFSPTRDFFVGMMQGEQEALDALQAFAAAVGFAEPYEPRSGCQAYPAFVAQLTRDGHPAEVAGAFLVNLEAWGANCARMRDALRRRYGLDDAAVAFFELFATPPPGFAGEATAVIEAGLRGSADPVRVARAARLLQELELLYWDSLPR